MIVDVPGIPIRRRGGTIAGYALVDADLFVRLNDAVWHLNNGYVARFTHSLGIAGAHPGAAVDHITGDRLDNRRENLRLSTTAQNAQNLAAWRPRFGYRGVTFNERRGHWVAQCMLNGRMRHLGSFATEEEAAQAAAAFRAHHMPFSAEARV